MSRRCLRYRLVTAAVLPLATQAAHASPSRLECPPQAPVEWPGIHGPLTGVQVLSAKRGEPINEAAPPDLVPDRQMTRAGSIHQLWQMNSAGPDWLYYVWCHYAGSDRILKLAALGVKQCQRTMPAAHPDRPPQQMVCD